MYKLRRDLNYEKEKKALKMWMMFAILSMVLCAMGEMLSNKIVRENTAAGPLMVYSATSFFCFLSAIAMWLVGIGESGASPVGILIEHPLIILSTASTFLSSFLMFSHSNILGYPSKLLFLVFHRYFFFWVW